jgi:hypothetical protein
MEVRVSWRCRVARRARGEIFEEQRDGEDDRRHERLARGTVVIERPCADAFSARIEERDVGGP